MDGLRKLEEVQIMLSFMTCQGLSSHNPNSDRFLAHFLLFLVKTCGSLDVAKKCRLISQTLPKMSPALLGEALLCVGATPDCKQSSVKKSVHRIYSDNKRDSFSARYDLKDMAVVGLDSMKRANSTLEDFVRKCLCFTGSTVSPFILTWCLVNKQCRSYFMFHEMDVNEPQTIFKYLPVLSFTESFIYQLDSLNEEIVSSTVEYVPLVKRRCPSGGNMFTNEGKMIMSNHFLDTFRTDPMRPLLLLLEHEGLLTERIKTVLNSGNEYWALERKLCNPLASREEISAEDVMRAIHLKSFDYRVLNLLLYKLRGQPVNDLHMEFLSISEFLVEISDDLFDYEDDVVENNFNILRMFVRLYGASMAPSKLAKCISEAEENYECLLKALDPELSSNYRRRCEAATKEGGNTVAHALGTWNIPHVIADEDAYRAQIMELQKQ